MLTKLAVRRLTKLADFMDALPRKANEHFDMASYFWHRGNHSVCTTDLITKDLFDCHTSACALGWAATIPAFKRAGLRFEKGNIVLKEEKNCFAGQRFFGLDCNSENFLFGSSAIIRTPKQWAKRCRNFIKENA